MDLATGGIWTATPWEGGWQISGPAGPAQIIAIVPPEPGDAQVGADAAFIAHARPDLLLLLRALARRRAPGRATLAAIAQRAAQATRAPWAWRWEPGRVTVYCPAQQDRLIALVVSEAGGDQRVRDAAFIAACRGDVERLLTAVGAGG